ncbi:hypothetical protein FAZ78_16915 [Cereibacter changlensis]|uniref:Uncharacterized protein n=1 Tax=Cereibacter changlensis TaxID=402884 RepID=A0A4U0YXP7_9RHOB|nr:hypothetical protein [Cereibacter changlensis]TKA95416.1 hypothetical protein FAZ78_16915 [Cereibacter changlensis]
MTYDLHHHLIRLCDAYAAHANISHWRVAFLARGDGQFFKRLREGKGCTVKTASATVQWFSNHWPADLEWPADIPRPPKSKEAA